MFTTPLMLLFCLSIHLFFFSFASRLKPHSAEFLLLPCCIFCFFFLDFGSSPLLPIIASLPCHHSFSLLLHFGLTCTLSSLSFTPSSVSAAELLPFSQEWFTSLLQLPPCLFPRAHRSRTFNWTAQLLTVSLSNISSSFTSQLFSFQISLHSYGKSSSLFFPLFRL